MSTEDLEAALASLRASVTESRAVSVEWPLLKPDWLLSRTIIYYILKYFTCIKPVNSDVETVQIRKDIEFNCNAHIVVCITLSFMLKNSLN